METGRPITHLIPLAMSLQLVTFVPDGKSVLIQGGDKSLRYYDVEGKQCLGKSLEFPDLKSMSISLGQNNLVMNTADNGIFSLPISESLGTILDEFLGMAELIAGVRMNEKGEFLSISNRVEALKTIQQFFRERPESDFWKQKYRWFWQE